MQLAGGGINSHQNSSMGRYGYFMEKHSDKKRYGVRAGLYAYRLSSLQSSHKTEEEIEVSNVNGNSELLFDSGFGLNFVA